jgi:hypothetical protein
MTSAGKSSYRRSQTHVATRSASAPVATAFMLDIVSILAAHSVMRC